MKLTVKISELANAIIDEHARETFKDKFDLTQYPYGIEVTTCDKWTTKQQHTIFRDMGIVARLLETSKEAIYSILKTSEPTGHLFKKTEYVGTEERGKLIEVEKSLSGWTKDDCIVAIPVIREYLEMVVCSVYQQRVIINWSDRENVNEPDYIITDEPWQL